MLGGTLFYTLNIITLSISIPLTVSILGSYTDNIRKEACDRTPNKRQIKREISPLKKNKKNKEGIFNIANV